MQDVLISLALVTAVAFVYFMPVGGANRSASPERPGDTAQVPAVAARWPNVTIGPPPEIQPGAVIRPVAASRLPSTQDAVTLPPILRWPVVYPGTLLEASPTYVSERVVSPPVTGTLTAAVANIPNRTSASGFGSSLRTLTAGGPDVVLLNEVSARSLDGIRAAAPGYDAYRDPVADRTAGGSQAMNNVVMWRTDEWSLVDGGRIKIVEDDRGFLHGKAFTWDRFATWVLLERASGERISVVSTHQMTNPAKYPRQHGSPSMSRVEQFARGMDLVVDLVGSLSANGPVLVGGDMNSHPGQGGWTAAAKLSAAGFSYAKDQGVMYLFHPSGSRLVDSRQVRIASDHPGLLTTLDLSG